MSTAKPHLGTEAPADAGLAPWQSPFGRETKALLTLAWPLILGFLGNQLLGIVDTAMVGRLGEVELAGTAVGTGVFFAISCLGLGAILGTDPLLAQAIGAGEGARVEAVRKSGLRVALWLTAPLMIAILVFGQILPKLGVEPPTARAAGRFLLGRSPSVLPFMLFNALRGYLQSRSHTRPIVIASIVANVVNFVFNALLIFGDRTLVALHLPAIGLPALGVLGSGIASSLASCAMFAVLFYAQRGLEVLPGGGETRGVTLSVLRLGVPIGLTLVAEVGAFASVGVLAAGIGAHAAAGHQVAITLASSTFIVTLAIGSATTVRVGQAVGRGDRASARITGFVGLFASSAFMSVSAVVFLVFGRELASILSDRPEVLAASVPLVHIAAVFQIFDGAQAVGAGALRGIGDTRFIQIANIVGYYAIGLPIALLLAFVAGQAERGLWWGLTAGLVAVAVALYARFWVLSSRPIERVR
jgi:MATE family multidrug resistance protein